MTVKRIVPNFHSTDPAKSKAFYRDVLDLEIAMDFGWIVTFAAETNAPPQLSIASEGGAGTMVPDVSIEVDDVDAVYRRAQAGGHDIVYSLCDEDWGVRRFYVRDPCGKVLNILSHS